VLLVSHQFSELCIQWWSFPQVPMNTTWYNIVKNNKYRPVASEVIKRDTRIRSNVLRSLPFLNLPTKCKFTCFAPWKHRLYIYIYIINRELSGPCVYFVRLGGSAKENSSQHFTGIQPQPLQKYKLYAYCILAMPTIYTLHLTEESEVGITTITSLRLGLRNTSACLR
jgi:hypothetical protein